MVGAAVERAPEGPTATVAKVAALADAMPPRMLLAALLAAWCQLRRAEIVGLERRDLDLLHSTIAVTRVVNRVKGGLVVRPPKSAAGVRTVTIPPHVADDVKRHLDTDADNEPTAPVCTGDKVGRLVAGQLYAAFAPACGTIGRPEIHLHDLRHSGATWLAIAGATTRELQARCGHARPAAALRYQFATADRDAALAAALSELAPAAPVTPLSHRRRDIRGMEASNPVPATTGQIP